MKVKDDASGSTATVVSIVSLGVAIASMALAPDAKAQAVGLVNLHNFGACPNGLPTTAVSPGTVVPCYIYNYCLQPSHNTDGAFPITGLTMAADGSLFGIAASGMTRDGSGIPSCSGQSSPGSIYSIATNGAFNVLYAPAKSMLVPMVLGPDNNLYGAYEGPFRFTTSGQFSQLPGRIYTGYGPLLMPSGGGFVAVETNGDSDFSTPLNYGAIVTISTTGAKTLLHGFSSPIGGVNNDGYYPWAGLTLGSDGNYYGTATKGGTYGYGTIYQLTPAGTFTTLHSFSGGTDGSNPLGQLLMAKDGNLYGTTHEGGTYGNGTLFKISLAGAFTTVHSFVSSEGRGPTAGLVQDSLGNLYGTASGGGAYGSGAIFKYSSLGAFVDLYSFSPLQMTNADGAMPNGVILGVDSNLYGTAELGGANGTGTIFELIIQKPKFTTMKVSPSYVAAGTNSTLSWATTSATSCTASGSWSGSQPNSGTAIVSQLTAGKYPYTLTCAGPAGSIKKTVTLTVH